MEYFSPEKDINIYYEISGYLISPKLLKNLFIETLLL